MSGEVAFGQQKQQPTNVKGRNSVETPRKKADAGKPGEHRILSSGGDEMPPTPSPIGGGNDNPPPSTGGGNSGSPWIYNPIIITPPAPPGSSNGGAGGIGGGPGGVGGSPSLVLYEDICSCNETEPYTYNVSNISDLAPDYIKALAANLPECDRETEGGKATETYGSTLTYKVSEYVTPGTQDKSWICQHGTVSSYDYLETWTHKHCTYAKVGNQTVRIPEITFTWNKTSTKSGFGAQADVNSWGRCP